MKNNTVKARFAQLKARLDYQSEDVLTKIEAAKSFKRFQQTRRSCTG